MKPCAGNQDTPRYAAASALISLAAIAFGLWRLRFGINLADEGLALAAPLRYALGDIPFRDEVLNPLRWFDIMMTPVIRALPDDGSVLILRHAALAFRLICIAALLRRFRPACGPLLTSIIFAASAYSSYTGYWTPTYHDAAFGFICLTLAAATRDTSAPKRALLTGALAGIAAAFAIFSEAPIAALLLVTGAIAAHSAITRGMRNPATITFATLTATAAALTAAAFALIYSRGLLPDLLNSFHTQLNTTSYGGTPAGKAAAILNGMRDAAPWAIMFIAARAAMAVPVFATKRHTPAAAVLSLFSLCAAPLLCLSIPFIYIYVSGRFFAGADILEGLCIACMILYPALRIARPVQRTPSSTAHTYIFIIASAWHFLLAYIAATDTLIAAQYTFPIFLALLASETRRALTTPPPGTNNNASLFAALHSETILCAATAALVIFLNLFSMHENTWAWRLTATFPSGKLRGIHTSPYAQRDISAASNYITARVKEGDTLLVLYDAPLLNYLTNTRPAMQTSQTGFYWPAETRRRFIRTMLKRNRKPQYALQLLRGAESDPIYDFVIRNYTRDAIFGSITVWRASTSNHAAP